jgi:hypothetical protein
MRHSIRTLATVLFTFLLLTAAAARAVTVTVNLTSPSGSGSASPVRFTATATDSAGYPITGYVVYSDNNNVYQNHVSTLDTWVILPFGNHSIYVRAWDSHGNFGTSQTFGLNVQGAVIPTPLAGAKTFGNLDDLQSWGSCGTIACAGGGANATSWPITYNNASPSKDGGSAHIQINGPGYADALWWYKMGAQDNMTNYLWDFWFYLPSNAALEAVEHDIWQSTSIGGTMKKLMFGTQCDYADGFWDTWNGSTWVQSSFSCGMFSTGTWHHLVYFVQRIGDNRDTLLYANVTLDDTTTQWNITSPAVNTNWQADTGSQHQLDLNHAGGTADEYFDLEKVTAWPD